MHKCVVSNVLVCGEVEVVAIVAGGVVVSWVLCCVLLCVGVV